LRLQQVASGHGVYSTVASPFTQPHAVSGIAELALDEPDASTPVLIAWRSEESSKAVVDFVHSALEALRGAAACRPSAERPGVRKGSAPSRSGRPPGPAPPYLP
jgi:hypothetical protein